MTYIWLYGGTGDVFSGWVGVFQHELHTTERGEGDFGVQVKSVYSQL